MSFSPLGLTPLIGVFDTPRALAFYRDVLGFAVVSASPEVETAEGRFSHWMWLRFGQTEIRLNTQYDSNERPVQPPEKRSKDVVFYVGCSDAELHCRFPGSTVAGPRLPWGIVQFFEIKPFVCGSAWSGPLVGSCCWQGEHSDDTESTVGEDSR